MSLLINNDDVERWFTEADCIVDRAVTLAVTEIETRAASGDTSAQAVLDSWTRDGARQNLKRRFAALDQRFVANGIVEQTRVPSRLSVAKADGSRQMTLFASMTRVEAEAVFQAQMSQIRTRQRWLAVMRRIFTAWDERPELVTLGEAAAAAGVDLRALDELAA